MDFGEYLRGGAFWGLDRIRGGAIRDELRDVDAMMRNEDLRFKFHAEGAQRLIDAASKTRHYSSQEGAALTDFPVLNKSEIKQDPGAFRNPDFRREDLVHVATSGSYGVPLSFWLTERKKRRQLAEVIYTGRWANYHVGTRHMYARALSDKGRFRLWVQNEFFAQTDHPDAEWLDEQLRALRRRRIRVIIGFPSVIALMAERALRTGLDARSFSIRGVITSGESLREDQRKSIEKALGGPCLSRYSSEEVGVIAAECRHGLHHVNEASYIVEVLRLHDGTPAREGELGRIVLTDLFSDAMPLIRYDTGDLGVVGPRCSCGINTATLSAIEGRAVELLTTREGRHLTPFFINPIMKDLAQVRQFQFAQVSEDRYELRVIGTLNHAEEEKTRRALRAKLGQGATVDIVKVDDIATLPSGKRPYVVNEMATRSLEV